MQHASTGTLLFAFAPMCAGSLSCSLYMGGGAACACLATGRATAADLLQRRWGCLTPCLSEALPRNALLR